MPKMVLRLGILAGISTGVWLLISQSRRFIEAQRQQALTTAPLSMPTESDSSNGQTPEAPAVQVRILAFKSPNCQQCRQMQTPALQRVLEARGDVVTVVDVDATSEHELVETYRVMTVPSTVLLDATGQPQAINYGFANTQRLLDQVDEILSK